MNELVAKFIEEKKKEQENKLKKQREEHLLNLGIVDNSNVTKKYCSKDLLEWQRKEYGYIYHDENGYFRYNENPVALDISDEDYAEICKLCPPESNKIEANESKLESNSFAENVVTVLAWILLLIGVVGGLAFMINAGESYDFNWSLFGTGIGLLLSCSISWGVLLVLANISRKLDLLNK